MDRAFRLFTARIDEWWPPERRHLKHPASVIALSPDRFWESAPNGDAVELGQVQAWEPPKRIVLDWFPGTDPEHPTRVEVDFVSEGEGTSVQIKHRAGPASVDLFPLRAPRYAASWDLVLQALAGASQT
ncbi:MAG: SRPBCC domain-containing protein [Polyangiaceae bacterium]